MFNTRALGILVRCGKKNSRVGIPGQGMSGIHYKAAGRGISRAGRSSSGWMNTEVRSPQSRRTNPDLSRLGSSDLTGGDRILACRFARSAAPRLHVREHCGHFIRAQAQIRHPSVLVLLEQGDRDPITLGEHLVRSDDVTLEPGAVPPRGNAREVRPHLVALPDGMADAALALKEVFSRVKHERTRLRIALLWRRILPTQKIRYRGGEELRVVHGGVAHPQSPWFVADHEAGGVAVLPDRVAHPG